MDGLLSGAGLPVLVSQGNPSMFLQNLNLLPKLGNKIRGPNLCNTNERQLKNWELEVHKDRV